MRKCPNCKKAVPVGARRCVHCRTLIGDAEEGSTRLGFGGSRHEEVSASEADHNNSTSFGRPGSAFSKIDEDDARGGGMMGNDAPHQTMLGLGPISSSASRRMFDDSAERGGFAQTTISGMPGISFDSGRQSLRGALNMAPVQMRTPAREINPVSMGIPQAEQRPVEIRHSSPHEVVAESLMGVSFDDAPKPAEISAPKVELEQEPVIEPPASDPFAGLPGVAPKPSSLVDEEFVDLTSKLFGDDFAAGTKDEDLEDDGWDFDLPPEEPKKPEPAPEKIEPAPVKVEEPKAEVKPAAAAVEKAAEAVAKPKEETAQSAAASEKPKSAAASDKALDKAGSEKQAKEETRSLAKSDDASKAKAQSGFSISSILAAAACLLGIVWLIMAFAQHASEHKGFIVAAGATVLASIIGGLHANAGRKSGGMLWAVLLLLAALLLFVAGALTDAGKAVGQILLLAAAAIDFICCGIAIFKKR